LKKTFR